MYPMESALQADRNRLRGSFRSALAFVALLWLLMITDTAFHLELTRFGVYPLRLSSLPGILLAPLVHGSWSHLFANTLPVMVLGTALLYGYPRSAKIVLPAVWLGSGLGVWLFAREAYHIGASGLTFGVMFFLFVVGALRWDKRAIVLSMIVFFLYGSMIWGIFPTAPGISYESHFFGALTGVLLAVVLRNHDPKAPEKKYSWEDEDDEETGSENNHFQENPDY
jgi:membrane associated rhomboid family serine protease